MLIFSGSELITHETRTCREQQNGASVEQLMDPIGLLHVLWILYLSKHLEQMHGEGTIHV